MEFENIRLERDGGLAYLVLNRPDKFNALSRAMIREMAEALEGLGTDRSVRVVVIRAEGKHFCTGHDLSEMVDRDTVDYQEIFSSCTVMMNRVHEIPQPVIAQVHGIATAAGCQLTAACDLALAEEGARFATPGVRIGLFCATPMVPLFRAVGRKRALEMLLTGRNVSAAEAADWGLINRVVPLDRLAEETRELASNIAQASPLTLAIGKQAFYDSEGLAETQAYDLAKRVMAMSLTTHDAGEGISAFLGKRPPDWKGR
ncbi:MAG: enoyl-CoA hydratase [Proteobacteria bacterium]|nr:enoyl-CoA hydratase [Pseudomonadota bacterium]